MIEPQDEKAVRPKEVEHIGRALSEGLTLYLNSGYTPGEVVAGLAAAVYACMKSFDMSDMEISNSLHKFADEVREKALLENRKPN